MQFDQSEKGFSFAKEGPLDMRMDPTDDLTAREIVNHWSEEQLGKIFRDYGEEKRWRAAAKAIVTARQKKRFETTTQLAQVISDSIGRGFKKRLHPATLIFQALRIVVNRELEAVKEALPKAIQFLCSGGRLGVLSFHSLEDRIVKTLFKQVSAPMEKVRPLLKILTKKPLVASREEIRFNPRARSAKLRFAEKI